MINIEITISISEGSSGWGINYPYRGSITIVNDYIASYTYISPFAAQFNKEV